jgi:GNAT superfamily N-acetyltransferase
VIRPATEDDLPAIERIVTEAYSIYVARLGREPAPMQADYAGQLDAGEIWVAADSAGCPVGVLVMRALATGLLLENVAVSPALQGQGIGRSLISFAEDHARSLGLGEVTLYTNERMSENLRLYPSLGYAEVDRHVEHGFKRVFFRKRL